MCSFGICGQNACSKCHVHLHQTKIMFQTNLSSSRAAYILEKLHDCCFFDAEVQPSMFFLTLHDAMLHIQEKHPQLAEKKFDYEKVKTTIFIH